MQYDGLAWAVALLAVLVLLVALRILLNTGWFLGWLRGTCGLAFLALAGLVGLLAYDLYAYEPLQPGKPLVTRRPSLNNKARCRVFYVGTDAGKDSIYGRLRVGLPGPLFWHFPLSADRDYFEQLTSEKRIRKMQAGRWVSRYECPPGRRNEVLDCEVLALVALSLVNVKLDDARVEAVPESAPERPPEAYTLTEASVAAPPRRQVKNLRRTGFVGRW